jgi:PAS domain S-box-containing protein
MRVWPRFTGTTVGLTVGITAAAAVACATAAYFYSIHHYESLLATARSTALAEGELIGIALEHQMMEKDRTLIAHLIESFGRQPGVANVMLLDRLGRPRYSSRALDPTSDLAIGSPTCQSCHRLPPEQRGRSRVIETQGKALLRTVVPFENKQRCQVCHDPAHRINGILILDVNVQAMRESMNRDLRWLVAGSGGLTILLAGLMAIVVRVVVMRRLRRFETTARQIAAGRLEQRVPAAGSDTISWLAHEFNSMADSVTGLLGEVKSQRQRLETIINSIDDGIVVLDGRRNVVAANDAFLQRSRRERQDVLGCYCGDPSAGLCNVSDCPTLACLETGERQLRICERQAEDGRVIWEEVHTSPLRDPAGGVAYVVEVWRDISDRRAAEARLAESHRLASLGLLASGFSHELNTPLATILTCVEGILRQARPGGGALDQAQLADSAAIAREQVLRCRGITQHFLRLSRGQKSQGDVVDLREAVLAVGRLVEPAARAHAVSIVIAPGAASPRVRADEADLQHALMNLLLNAVQACQPGGHVTVDVDDGAPVRIRVSDDGCGIAPEHQKRIFEPFFGLRKGGTGLGLFLSLDFVRRWGGDILVASAAGRGSTFEVVLPALESPPGAGT